MLWLWPTAGDAQDWCGDHALCLELQGCVRAVCAHARLKFRFLGQLPYLLVQLPTPGAKRRVLAQWDSAPAAAHHRVSKEFLAEGSELRAAIEAMGDDGSAIGGRLQEEIASLAALPLDDAVNEGPHAVTKRVQCHARDPKFAWQAATLRLGQSLEDARGLLPATGLELKASWCNWKAVVRSDDRGRASPKKMTCQAFEE